MWPGARNTKASASQVCQVSSPDPPSAALPLPSLAPSTDALRRMPSAVSRNAFTRVTTVRMLSRSIVLCIHCSPSLFLRFLPPRTAYECKNDVPYKARPTRTQLMTKPKRDKPSVEVPEEFLPCVSEDLRLPARRSSCASSNALARLSLTRYPSSRWMDRFQAEGSRGQDSEGEGG